MMQADCSSNRLHWSARQHAVTLLRECICGNQGDNWACTVPVGRVECEVGQYASTKLNQPALCAVGCPVPCDHAVEVIVGGQQGQQAMAGNQHLQYIISS